MNLKNSTILESNKTLADITWWGAKNLRLIRKREVYFVLIILFFAYATIWSGNMMVRRLTPRISIDISTVLDTLQIPRQLPNVTLKGSDGESYSLWSLIDKPNTVLSIYAPWCAPCQKELPKLVENLQKTNNLLVVLSSRENPDAIRRQIDNLGLSNLKFYVDITGRLLQEGKVQSLPTTFLIGKWGKVKERVVGYSEYSFDRLMKMATRN